MIAYNVLVQSQTELLQRKMSVGCRISPPPTLILCFHQKAMIYNLPFLRPWFAKAVCNTALVIHNLIQTQRPSTVRVATS